MTRSFTGAYGLVRETPGGTSLRGSRLSSEREGMFEAPPETRVPRDD